MSTEKNQSQIAEVRDQLCLDYADGKYLSNVTANIGLDRPVFGFDDTTWRAVVKTLALQYKQIAQKFRDVLAELLGPQFTQVATQTEDTAIGVELFVVNDSTGLPQNGTLILDEGLLSEETVDYCFIDRTTHTIFLDNATTQAHTGYDEDVSAALVFPASTGDTTLQIHVSDARRISSVPVSATLGLGTAVEETVAITAVDTDTGVVTLGAAIVNDHEPLVPSPIQEDLALAYTANAEYLVLDNSDRFPDEGWVYLGDSTSIAATGGSATTVTYTSGDLTENRHAGHVIVFEGNITPALAEQIAYVESNTATTATFRNTLPASPAAGDNFVIRPILRYTRNVYADNALQLTRDIADVTFPVNTSVELLTEKGILAMSPVKVVGVDWDVIQSDPRNIEIYIPEDVQDINTVRSAGYLHPAAPNTHATTVGTAVSIGDTTIELADATGFPFFGQVVIDSGGGNEEYLGYRRARSTDTYDATASTTTTLNITTGGLTAGAHVGERVYIDGDVNESRVITANTASSITFTDPLSNEDFAALVDGVTPIWVYSDTDIEVATDSATTAHLVGETVDYYEVVDSVTLQSGDLWQHDNTFPGPYLYDVGQDAPQVEAASTTLNQVLAGPTVVAHDSTVLQTAIEVEDAMDFPLGSFTPYQAIVGARTGNKETVTINEIALKQRTSTTVDVAGSTAGDTFIPVASLTGAGVSDDFLDANGYRVLLDRGGANEEVVYVTGTTVTPSAGLTVLTTVNNHVSGETVELMADVLEVDPLDDIHLGKVSASQRTDRWPGRIDTALAAAASIGDSTVTLTNTATIPDTGILRLGNYSYRFSHSTGATVNILTAGGVRSAETIGSPVYLLTADRVPETVEVLYDTVTLASGTGFPTTGGGILLNFGHGLITRETTVATAISPTDTVFTLDDTSNFPTTYPYKVSIDVGAGEQEERVLVTNNNTGTNQLTVATADAARFAHAVGAKVRFKPGTQEKVDYNTVDTNDLGFTDGVAFASSHYPSETVLRSDALSIPSTDGFDFPFRMPTDLIFRIGFLFDLIRAAGIQVTVIDQR